MIDERMSEIGELIRTQDNRITEAPLFAVQERRRIYGIDPAYTDDVTWLDSEYVEAEPDVARCLERAYRTGKGPSGWTRTGYRDVWEFVTACFTEQGCKEYLAANGHNHGETRIYAYGSFRNREWQDVRVHLMGLAL